MTPYVDVDICSYIYIYWFMYWLGADITWTNIDLSSVAFSEMSLEIILIAIIKVIKLHN